MTYVAPMIEHRIIATVLLFLAFAGASTGAVAQSGCVSPREGQQLVAEGQVRPFPDALLGAGYAADQLVGHPQLCNSGGRWIYRVRVLRGGNVSSVDIPAG